MNLPFGSNVNDGFFQNDGRNGLPINFSVNFPGQYHLSHLSPHANILDLSSSNIETQTTPLSVPSPSLQYTPVSSARPMAPFQDNEIKTQTMASMGYWKKGPDQSSETDGVGISPTATFSQRNMNDSMNGDVGYEKPTSPSQFGFVDIRPDLTPTGTRTHILESFYKERFGSSCLSLRDRLLHEVRRRVRGWPCHICHQRFKRRDYVKQHMKKKHPEFCDRLPYTFYSTPDWSVATPANSLATDDAPLASEFLEGEQGRYPRVFWNGQLNNQVANIFLSSDASPSHGITHQMMSLDHISAGGHNISGGSEIDSLPCLKTGHDNSTSLFACPLYKQYPLQHRRCFALSLRRPKDVKQHIYRSHTQPEFYCAMCSDVFDTATEREAHWRERLCDRLESSVLLEFQGITEDQKRMLNEKSPRDLGVEDQWFQIYAILFPVSEPPRSPYVGNLLEEIVPLLRQKWKTKCYEITAQAVGNLNHHQLGLAMDLFFRTLEGEALGHETVDNSISAAPAQSRMWDGIQREKWSQLSAHPGW